MTTQLLTTQEHDSTYPQPPQSGVGGKTVGNGLSSRVKNPVLPEGETLQHMVATQC